jgi:kanamycin kinase
VPDRTGEYLATVEENYRKGVFDPAFLPRRMAKMTAEEAFGLVQAEGHRLGRNVLLHGDYCLPNILLDGWRFSGFIDLDHAGVGDRHIDLFWGVWTLEFNLKTDRYADRFLDAYGRDAVDAGLLDVIGAAECFG